MKQWFIRLAILVGAVAAIPLVMGVLAFLLTLFVGLLGFLGVWDA